MNEDLGFLVGVRKCSGIDSGHVQPCDGAKNHGIVYFPGVNCIVCELY